MIFLLSRRVNDFNIYKLFVRAVRFVSYFFYNFNDGKWILSNWLTIIGRLTSYDLELVYRIRKLSKHVDFLMDDWVNSWFINRAKKSAQISQKPWPIGFPFSLLEK